MVLVHNYNSALNTNSNMRNPHSDFMASLLPHLTYSMDGARAGRKGLPAIPESRQVVQVSIRPDNARPLAQSASMTFLSLEEDHSQVKLSRWASVPTKLKDEAKSLTTKNHRKPRSSDDFQGHQGLASTLSATIVRSADTNTNTAPRPNDEWDLNRSSVNKGKLGSRSPKHVKNVKADSTNLFDLEKIVQGLASAALPCAQVLKKGRKVGCKKAHTPLSSPDVSSESPRIRRSERILSCGTGGFPHKKSALGPRYPLRQTSDPETVTDGPRRPLRKVSMERGVTVQGTGLLDASSKTV